jgi:formate dehydrogenase beta subunit
MPVYVDLLPPCNNACPAGENIQEWLRLLKAGDPHARGVQLTRDNPFPAIHGRVCYHPCESACNRADLDSAVSIHGVERYLGDMAIEQGWQFAAPAGVRPQGARRGRRPLRPVRRLPPGSPRPRGRDPGRRSPQPGGMMRYGIPEYRLPRDVSTPRWPA